MTSPEPLPADALKRKAVVYVRQSSQSQVMNNLESQRNMTWSMLRGSVAFLTSRSSMTISGDQQRHSRQCCKS